MELYDLGKHITAFTTDRNVGRDGRLLLDALVSAGCNVAEDAPFFYPHQTHTANVMTADEAFFRLYADEQKAAGEGIDAVISDVKGVCLGISTADCIPVIVYDEEHHAAAAIHAGWRGTVARIVVNAINAMQRTYSTRPEACRAVIGPGISQKSFEVGQEVVDTFVDNGFAMDGVTVYMPSSLGDGQRPHIDLKEVNRQLLLEAGLQEENIEVSPIDTFTDGRFFSARREQKGTTKCGRILTGFVLHHSSLPFGEG